jgi:hypothetical protein
VRSIASAESAAYGIGDYADEWRERESYGHG